jgi:hypothetical protein
MSTKAINLQVTGNIMEVPPAKEPTRALDRPKPFLAPLDLTRKKQFSPQNSNIKQTLVNRSFSQLSTNTKRSLPIVHKETPVKTSNNNDVNSYQSKIWMKIFKKLL